MEIYGGQEEQATAEEALTDGTATAKGCPAGLVNIPAVVLRNILKYLPVSDLVHNCSLVNKTWKLEGRCVLRDIKICIANLKKGRTECERFQDFEDLLSRITINPYNGLDTAGPERFEDNCICRGDGTSLWPRISSTHWTNLGVNWSKFSPRKLKETTYPKGSFCPAVQLMSDILLQKSQFIAYLEVFMDENVAAPRLPTADPIQHGVLFPHLKILKLTGSAIQLHPYDLERSKGESREFVAKLLSHAPNLKHLRYLVNARDLLEFFPPGTIAKVKEFLLVPPSRRVRQDHRIFDQLRQLRFIRARSEDVDPVAPEQSVFGGLYYTPEGSGRGWSRWAMVLPVFQNNYEHLERLETDYVVATVLMTSGLTPFRRVKKLCFYVSPRGFRVPHYQRLLRLFICQYFPRLESLTLTIQPLNFGYDFSMVKGWLKSDGIIQFINDKESNNSAVREGQTLSQLDLRLSLVEYEPRFTEAIFELVAQCTAYSSVRSFKFYECNNWVILPAFNKILSLPWLNVETVEICLDRESFIYFDAAVCGITEAEAEMLRQQPVSFLRNYQFAPVRPNIASFRSLRNLSIMIDPEGNQGVHSLFQLAACLAFERISELHVKIITWLDHFGYGFRQLEQFECIQLLNVDQPRNLFPQFEPVRPL